MRKCCRFTIDVVATPLSVVHYTVDLDNASCGLTFSADRVAYSGNLLLNHPMPGQLKPGMSAITRKRCFPHAHRSHIARRLPCVWRLSLPWSNMTRISHAHSSMPS